MPIGDRDRKIRVRQGVIALKRRDKPCVFRENEQFPAAAIIRICKNLKHIIPWDQRHHALPNRQSFIIKLRQQAL
jgi:UDP-N-acetylmuramyl tripeptide synthase